MQTLSMQDHMPRWLLVLMAGGLLASGPLPAQVPVDENGNPIEALDEGTDESDDSTENLSDAELQALVGPIALYPDDLLAIVLPASAYPLQIVQAARFLEQLEQDSSLEPDDSWDSSVTALLNYPEVIEMMNEDIDWTFELGEAVVRQQADVIAAVEAFRDRAYAAGNLKSDEHQTVTNDDGVIEIEPVEEEVIYVPYYEPERVVVYQTQPVYHYYPQPYPVYYYPYPAGYSFASDYFWGVTTAFTIGWSSNHLRVFHHSYLGHPYYGHHYFGHYYRRPTITIYNGYYVNGHVRRSRHHYRDGDFWRPRRDSGARPGHYRSRADYYRDHRRERSEDGYRRDGSDVKRIATRSSRHAGRRAGFRDDDANVSRRSASDATTSDREPIRFRNRARADVSRRADDRSNDSDSSIRFRARERAESRAAPRRSNRGERPAINRSQTERTVSPPSTRQRAVNRSIRSDSSHRDAAASRPATRTHTSRPSTPRPGASQRARPRASAPRAAPRASPRAAPRRATPRPKASRPAPTRERRATSPRRSSGASSRPTQRIERR